MLQFEQQSRIFSIGLKLKRDGLAIVVLAKAHFTLVIDHF